MHSTTSTPAPPRARVRPKVSRTRPARAEQAPVRRLALRVALRVALFVAAVLFVASIVDGYAAGPANRLVNPFPAPPTTTTSKEVTAP
jgi:hypothetical protein